MNKILLVILSLSLSSFAFAEALPFSQNIYPTDSDFMEKSENFDDILDAAEGAASVEGREVLVMARTMINDGVVVVGSCWDFIDAVYNRAKYPQAKRLTTYRSKLPGPYVDEALIEPGDWLYFMNHSYNNVEHSGIFVGWTNFATKEALLVSYAGGNQSRPARYKKYDLSSVYNIMRPKSQN